MQATVYCDFSSYSIGTQHSTSSAGAGGSMQKTWKMLGSGGRHVGDRKGVRKVRKRSGRPWESAEETETLLWCTHLQPVQNLLWRDKI